MRLASSALSLARAALRAVDPERATARAIRRHGETLAVGGRRVAPGPGGRWHVVAIGKAAGRMVAGAHRALGGPVPGIAVTSRGSPTAPPPIRTWIGEHPVPGSGSERAGRAVARFVDGLGPADAVLFLISGGGSALAELPWPPIGIREVARTTELLLSSGMPIGAANAVRRHLSRLKGGRLAARVRSGRFATVAISDVIGDEPCEVASGPTVPDPTTFRDALAAARHYGILARLPSSVRSHLRAGAAAEARTGASRRRRGGGGPFAFAATNATAVDAAARAARARWFRVVRLPRPIVGPTDRAARRFAARLLSEAAKGHGRVAVVGGGETTVRLPPHPGRGGRNQEFALVAARCIAGRPALVLSIGTDGIDGPTDAAGGWVDGTSAARARAEGIDLAAALARHDSLPVLERLGGLVRTGPTGTNVTDLHVGLAEPVSPGTGSRRGPGARASRRRRS
ncbi:MAG: DUF4147 domain-containing protein [Thermoplasmata archaeon]